MERDGEEYRMIKKTEKGKVYMAKDGKTLVQSAKKLDKKDIEDVRKQFDRQTQRIARSRGSIQKE